MTYTTDVLLICWFGTQLTQHVRKNTYCRSKNTSSKMNRKVQHNRELQTDFKSFILKCLRRRVWETQHSGVTGWELLSHFSDVWCSSLLQLTRSSDWQQESLFRCQISPQRMYVYVWCMYMCMYVCKYVCVCTIYVRFVCVCMYVCMYIFIRPSYPRELKLYTIGFLITDYNLNP